MNTSKVEVGRRMKRFEQVCREAGIKLTHQRMEVFREVAQSGEHPDAETVYSGVRKRLPTVSLDTVYRTLWLLNDLALVTTMGPAQQRARFDANLNSHHHFVCLRCGLTRDFYSDELDALKPPRSVKSIGQIESTHVEARGICRACATKAETKPKTKNKNNEAKR